MINLLPPEVKQRHIVSSRIYTLTLLYIVVLVILGLGAVALGTYNLTLGGTRSEREATLASLVAEKEKYSKLISQAAFVEDRLKTAKTYQETRKYEEVLDYVATSTPVDVQVTGINITVNEKVSLTITGETRERRSVILFRDKLSQVTGLEPASVANITEGSDSKGKIFAFTITSTLKKDAAKK